MAIEMEKSKWFGIRREVRNAPIGSYIAKHNFIGPRKTWTVVGPDSVFFETGEHPLVPHAETTLVGEEINSYGPIRPSGVTFDIIQPEGLLGKTLRFIEGITTTTKFRWRPEIELERGKIIYLEEERQRRRNEPQKRAL